MGCLQHRGPHTNRFSIYDQVTTSRIFNPKFLDNFARGEPKQPSNDSHDLFAKEPPSNDRQRVHFATTHVNSECYCAVKSAKMPTFQTKHAYGTLQMSTSHIMRRKARVHTWKIVWITFPTKAGSTSRFMAATEDR